MKAENTRSSIETLQSEILCIQEAISRTCLSMLKLRDEELYPQLLELSSGLTDFLPNNSQTNSTSEICALCEEWQLAVARLPDKAALEAIRSFISVIHSIVL
ncbi:hypothetical protein AAC387_Pa07g3352 [Persea americana]